MSPQVYVLEFCLYVLLRTALGRGTIPGAPTKPVPLLGGSLCSSALSYLA